jgi:uncharacterized protein YkwD
MTRNANKNPHTSKDITTGLIAAVIFVLLSSCQPQAMDQTEGTSPRLRKANGQTSGANNESAYAETGNSQGTNSTIPGVTNSNGSVNNISNSGTNNIANASNTDCYKADEFVCKVERLIGEKTNKYRQSRGLQPLALDAKIAFVSRDWSKKQAASGFIGHSGFPSSRMAVYRQEFNVSRSMRGENVAMTGRAGGSSRDDAAAERVANEFATMWWNSSGHRANMLGRFKNLGVGVHQTSRGSWYATQIFE